MSEIIFEKYDNIYEENLVIDKNTASVKLAEQLLYDLKQGSLSQEQAYLYVVSRDLLKGFAKLLVNSSSNTEVVGTTDVIAYIVSDLNTAPGVLPIILDGIRCSSQHHHIVLQTSKSGTPAIRKAGEILSKTGALFRQSPDTAPLGTAQWLVGLLASMNPATINLLCDPADMAAAVALSAASWLRRGKIIDYSHHHSQHAFTQGVETVIDAHHPGLLARLASAQQDGRLPPLFWQGTGQDLKALPADRFLAGGRPLMSATAGPHGPMSDADLDLLLKQVCMVLSVTRGQHFHIGVLTAKQEEVCKHVLTKAGLPIASFKSLAGDPSGELWRSLVSLKVDILIPFLGGGTLRNCIEALGAGVVLACVDTVDDIEALLALDQTHPDRVQDHVSSRLLSWLAQTTPQQCSALSSRGRAYYEQALSPARLKARLAITYMDIPAPLSTSPEHYGILFDRDYYLATNPDIAAAGVDPFQHYVQHGAFERRSSHPLFDIPYYLRQLKEELSDETPLSHLLGDGLMGFANPHPLFSNTYYLKACPAAGATNLPPLLHYIMEGAAQGINPHPLFDTAYYLAQLTPAERDRAKANPLLHFLRSPSPANPHLLFDCEYYLLNNTDVAKNGTNPLAHFISDGAREKRNPHPLFEIAHYLESAGADAVEDPVGHYLTQGGAISPHPLFQAQYYLEHNPDAIGHQALLVHYLGSDPAENRRPHPFFDAAHYRTQLPDGSSTQMPLLLHFQKIGSQLNLNPHWLFDTAFYRQSHGSWMPQGEEPLLHFVRTGCKVGCSPHPLLNITYLVRGSGAADAFAAINMYLSTDKKYEIDPHPLFDTKFYLRRNPEVRENSIHPLMHFLTVGHLNNCDPHPLFSMDYYMSQVPELADQQINLVIHFLTSNRYAQIDPHPLFSVEYYLQTNPSVEINPLMHYLWNKNHSISNPHPAFNSAHYTSSYGDAAASGLSPLHHYIEYGIAENRLGLPANPTDIQTYGFFAQALLRAGNTQDACKAVERSMGISTIRHPMLQVISAPYQSPESWCRENGYPVHVLRPAYRHWLSKPRIYHHSPLPVPGGAIDLPATYVAEIPDALVIGSASLLLSSDGRILSDELVDLDINRHHAKSRVIKGLTADQCLLAYYQVSGESLKQGIHLCIDYTNNYFHWIVECLPRLAMLDQMPEYDGIPLIIEDQMPRQHEEALRLVNKQNRRLIRVRRNQAIKVEKLIYLSQISFVHDNMSHVPVPRDVKISPVAMRQLREWFQPVAQSGTDSLPEYIYISRRDSSYRRLRNEEEIENIMLTRGFAVIKPEQFTLTEQIRLFANAKVIVGPTGAGITNIVFASPGCQVFVLYNGNEFSNYYLWGQMADALGVHMNYVVGREIKFCFADEKYVVHNDFLISAADIECLLDNVMSHDVGIGQSLQSAASAQQRLLGGISYLTNGWGLLARPMSAAFEQNLRQSRQQVAMGIAQWPQDELEKLLTLGLYRNLYSFTASSLVFQPPLDEAEANLKQQIATCFLSSGVSTPVLVQAILLAPLYFQAFELPLLSTSKIGQLSPAMASFYMNFLTLSPQLGHSGTDELSYMRFLGDLADMLQQQLLAYDGGEISKVMLNAARKLDFSTLYFVDQPIRTILDRRCQLLAAIMRIDPMLDSGQLPAPAPITPDRKIRLGFLCRSFRRGPDIEALCAQFSQFDKDRYEIFAFTIGVNDRVSKADQAFDTQFNRVADKRIPVSGTSAEIIKQIRQQRLDIFVLSTVTSFGMSDMDVVMAHRFAPIQVALNSIVPTSTGLPSFDYFVSMSADATAIDSFQSECVEKVRPIPGVPICYVSDGWQEGTKTINRSSIGLLEEDIVFYNAGAVAKLTHELLTLWCRIVRQVPGGKLLLAPFNPGWSGCTHAYAFQKQLDTILAETGLDRSRVVVLGAMEREEAEQIPGLADIYLSSFPFGGATSITMALRNHLPVVARRSPWLRCVDPVLVMEAGLPELVGKSVAEYEAIAVALGIDKSWCQSLRERLATNVKHSAVFDTVAHSTNLQHIFDQIVLEKNARDGEPVTLQPVPEK